MQPGLKATALTLTAGEWGLGWPEALVQALPAGSSLILHPSVLHKLFFNIFYVPHAVKIVRKHYIVRNMSDNFV